MSTYLCVEGGGHGRPVGWLCSLVVVTLLLISLSAVLYGGSGGGGGWLLWLE